MKVKAHLVVQKEYGLAISASQWIEEVQKQAEEYNQQYLEEDYLCKDRKRAVITVEFDVPDSIFLRELVPQVEGKREM